MYCTIYFNFFSWRQHPVIFLKDVPPYEMELILRFIYNGEVYIAAHQLQRVLKVARELGIKGNIYITWVQLLFNCYLNLGLEEISDDKNDDLIDYVEPQHKKRREMTNRPRDMGSKSNDGVNKSGDIFIKEELLDSHVRVLK